MSLKKRIFYQCSSVFLLLSIIFLSAFPTSASVPEVVRVGFFQMDGYHMIDEYGERSGYGYEYLQNLAQYTDFSYEYIGYDKSWSEMQNMLQSGEIDLLTCVKKTNTRETLFNFTDRPIGTNVGVLTVRAGDNRYMTDDFSQYNRICIGMQEKNVRNQDFAKFAREKGFSYIPVYFKTDAELLTALHQDQAIDAIVTSNLRRSDNEWIAATFAPSPFYAAVRKDNSELLKEVNRAIAQVDEYNPNLQSVLMSKYYSVKSGDEIAYTADERAYIKNLQESGTPIEILIKSDRPPLSFLDGSEAKGILPDVAGIVLGRAGIPYKIVMPPSRREYQEVLASGAIDVCFDGPYDFNEAEKNGHKLTEPFIEVALSCITRKNYNEEPKTIAAIKDSDITMGYIDKKYEEKDVVYYDTMEECVNAILSGQQDAAYFHTYVAQELVYNDIRNRLKSVLIPEYVTKYSISVQHAQTPLLFSILNKAVLNLNQEELNRIILEQTTYPLRPLSLIGYLYNNPIAVAVLMGMLGLIILAALLYFFRRKNARLERERVREFERFITYVCRANDEVLELDLNKQVCFSYRVENGSVIREGSLIPDEGSFKAQIYPEDFDLIAPIIAPKAIRELADNGKEAYVECRTNQKDSEYLWYSYTLQGMQGDARNPGSLMIFIKDIDRSKKEEIEKKQVMKDALSAAMQASESKGAFMSRMSHEIRTPLNAIIGYLSLANAYTDNPQKVGDCLQKSEFAAHHLLRIVNDILDISAIESGRMKIAHEPFDMTNIIAGITSIFSAQAEAKGVRYQSVIKDLTENLLIGDPLRVNQILMNLLSNSIKFTPEGNSVTLTVAQKIIVENKVHLQITIEDTGIGISESYMEKLFTPFEQQDATVARKFGGSGLGLSITKNLIDMMNGTIDVSSREGEGTTFLVGLAFEIDNPKEQVSNPTGSETEGSTSRADRGTGRIDTCELENYSKEEVAERLKHAHVLLVEDNELNMEISVEMLRSTGIIVDGAVNGQIALDVFKKSAPDTYQAILMDIQMPVMDGYEATRKIRGCDHIQAADIPIIALTADVFAEDINRSLAAGMNDHVSKPIDFCQLLEVLNKYIGKDS